ncbi:helix-hairpin-helix domain-containing protein [Paenibacillus sp. FSL R5-0912]|uniref:helix-hairpin-helix domain-containing protein n=1 Tax=Paenibacillus sp. FSL R5-0912 TaxID=1536771 RepID=UPI000694D8D2|nr:helix-hairpin-helix domain-containing protein [Paenibacillus sp. FSL R5-0912]
MGKRMIGCAIAAALLGGALVWAADHRAEDGIAGWETLNAGMAQALGVADGGAGTAGESGEAGAMTGEAGVKAKGEGGNVNGAAVGKAGAVSDKAGAASDNAGVVNGAGITAPAGTSGAVAGRNDGNADGKDGTAVGGGIAGVAENGTANGGTVGAIGGAGPAGAAGAAVAADGRVNVNIADTVALMDLPGIGEKKAQAIIEYRSSKGAFRSLTDLGKVKGIGPKLLEQLKPLVAF